MTPPRSPEPTGTLVPGTHGPDLVLTRRFRAPVDDVWASITEPERTARWFATWHGDAGPGKTIRYRMTHEGDCPEDDMVIEACEAPHHLAVKTVDENGTWRLEARLTEEPDGTTLLTLVHHLEDKAAVGSVGPGWEYYLDMLVASRRGDALPDFDDYYPAQKDYYEGLA